MLTDTTPSSRRSAAIASGRVARARRTAPRPGALLAIALVLCGLVFGQAGAESAGAATPGPSQGIGTPAPPVAPTIEAPNSDAAKVGVTGTATPGASLRILDPAHPASSLCTVRAATDGTWACTVTLSSGPDQTLTVRDLTHAGLADVVSAPFSVLAAPILATRSGVNVGAKASGTAYPGAQVALTLSGSRTPVRVTGSASASGAWTIILPASTVASGTYSLSATQASSAIPAVPLSSRSSVIATTIDRDAPAAPRLLHPAASSTVSTQPLVFDGTGESGSTVTTYVDSNPVCTAVVSHGSWSCSSRGLLIPAGSRTVQAAQRDPAGNYGSPSTGSRVVFAAVDPSTGTTKPSTSPSTAAPTPSDSASADPQPAPSPGSSATAAPATPGGAGDGGSSGSGGGGAAGSSGSGGTSSGGGEAGSGSGGGGSALGPALSDVSSWTASTGFGSDLPTLSQSVGGLSWVWALVLGMVFLLLVIAPIRLAASALGGRLAVRAGRFTGRNRARSDRSESSALSPGTAIAASLAVGALLVALAAGVDDQLQYVRLAVSILIGLGVVNGLGVVLPTWASGHRLGLRFRLRLAVSPRLLVAAAAACLVTRVLHLDPPMVLGVLLTASLLDADDEPVDGAGRLRRGGIVATAQLSSLAVLSFAAWVAHGALPTGATGFGLEVTRETLATVCLTGLGSLIVLLVPVGRLPGRAIYSWSRATLAGVAVVGVAVAAVVYTGGEGEAFPVVPLVVAAAVFAAVAVGTWVWVRFVEPALDDATLDDA